MREEIGVQLDIPQDVLVQMLGVGIRKQVKYDNDKFIRDFVKDKNTIYTKVDIYEEEEEKEEKRMLSADAIPSLTLKNSMELKKKLEQKSDLLTEIMEQRRKSQLLSTNIYTITDSDEEIDIEDVEAEYYGDEIEYDDEDLDLAEDLKLSSKEEIEEYEKGLKEEADDIEADDIEDSEDIEDDTENSEEIEDDTEDSEDIEADDIEDSEDIEDGTEDRKEIEDGTENSEEIEDAIEGRKERVNIAEIDYIKEQRKVETNDRKKEKLVKREEIKKSIRVKQLEKGDDKVEKSSESTENSDVIFIKGMSLVEFLRNNPKIREIKSVLKWFTKEQIQDALDNDEVLAKKGKFIL